MVSFKNLFIATRPWSFVMTAISATGAAAYAYYLFHAFNFILYILTLMGLILVHAAANLLNDYYDTMRKVDVPGAPTTLYRPHPIISGIMTPEQTRNYALIFMGIGFAIALVLSVIREFLVIILALAGLILLLTYSGPPGLKYRGMGEIGVVLSWGVFMWLGTFYVISGRLALEPVLAGVPIGLLIAAVLTANNLRDIEFDLKRGAKTFVASIGREKGLKFYAFEIAAAYIIVVVLISLRMLPATTALVFLSLPQAVKLVRTFAKRIPEAADPMTAQLVQNFGIIYIIGILLGDLIKL